MLRITLGESLLFGGGDARDERGAARYTIAPGSLTGWWGSPDAVGGGASRPSAHGAFDDEQFLGERIIGWRGLVRATAHGRGDAIRALTGLPLVPGLLPLTVDDGDGPLGTLVRVRRAPIDRETAGHHPAYALTLAAPDPFLYGEPRLSANDSGTGDSHASHDGNALSWPWITVTGVDPLGYRIVHRGGSYRVTAPIAAGDVDVIDFRDGTLVRNGQALDTAITNADRFAVAGGAREPWRIEAITTGAALHAELVTPSRFV